MKDNKIIKFLIINLFQNINYNFYFYVNWLRKRFGLYIII
jgi:hypothetical protein